MRLRLHDLVTSQQVSFRLIIVRYFNDDDGEEELLDTTITKDGKLLGKLPGQHQLLGWSLACEQLAFLASIQRPIWADEYG